MAEQFRLREVFNPALVQELAGNIAQVWVEFEEEAFVEAVVLQLPELNFGDRSSLIADSLRRFLPQSYETAVGILIDALPPQLTGDMFTGYDGFEIMPQCLFVSRYGLDNFDVSINALYEMTKRFTAEGDIRPFIHKFPVKTMAFLHQITQDESPFARRLASEGTRPRLPLTPRLPAFQKDPRPVLELLEKLKEDPILMVRRSVANNLNDISKDNPGIVVETLQRWQKLDTPEMDWIIAHALRTILKQGHPGALRLLGYDPQARVLVSDLQLNSPEIKVGETLRFSFEVTSQEERPCALMIDTVIHYMKANGKQKAKVFKAAKKRIAPGETISIEKGRSFKAINTRPYYAGQHALEIQINGQRHAWADFTLMLE
jgi:3-methyladenine DNA glycosylase AlkC